MSNKLREKLDEFGLEIIQELDTDRDAYDNEIFRYACKREGRPVTAEYYFDGFLDIFFCDTDDTIFEGYIEWNRDVMTDMTSRRKSKGE